MYVLKITLVLFGAAILAVACGSPGPPAIEPNMPVPGEAVMLPPQTPPPVMPPPAAVLPPSPPPIVTPPMAVPPLSPMPEPPPFEFWIVGNEFKPGNIRIDEGSVVTWVNKDSVAHRIVPSTASSNAMIYQDPVTNEITINGATFLGYLEPGGSTSIALMTAGHFFFYLEDNPGATGLIRVQG